MGCNGCNSFPMGNWKREFFLGSFVINANMDFILLSIFAMKKKLSFY